MSSGSAKEMDDDYNSVDTYYGIAHTYREKIKEQATIMVNGMLKEYQVCNKSLFHFILWIRYLQKYFSLDS